MINHQANAINVTKIQAHQLYLLDEHKLLLAVCGEESLEQQGYRYGVLFEHSAGEVKSTRLVEYGDDRVVEVLPLGPDWQFEYHPTIWKRTSDGNKYTSGWADSGSILVGKKRKVLLVQNINAGPFAQIVLPDLTITAEPGQPGDMDFFLQNWTMTYGPTRETILIGP